MANEQERAVVTVIGKDAVGILAKVSGACANASANVVDVTQSVMQDFFCMIMIIDIAGATMSIDELQESISNDAPGMKVHVMHENIFDAMHRI